MAGAMRMPTDVFWSTTPREFISMADGFAASKGAKRDGGAKAKAPTRAEMQDWIEKEKRGERF